MHLTLWVFGRELFAVSTDSPSPEPDDDCERDLSGGTTCSDRIDPGPTDRYLGVTNGRESSDDDA